VTAPDPALVLDRLSWGARPVDYQRILAQGSADWIREQLRADAAAPLPAAIEQQIAGMTITQMPLATLVYELEAQRRSADALVDDGNPRVRAQVRALSHVLQLLGSGEGDAARDLLEGELDRSFPGKGDLSGAEAFLRDPEDR